MIYAGIDAGSRSIKAVLFDTGRSQILASGLADQGVEQERLATELFEKLLRDAGLERSQISGVVATGYGRNAIRFADTTITEITCHARGVHRLAPAARTIIEIGGQDSKVIVLEDGGRVRDFAMNDRCAAGTGRFLEMVATRLEMNWEKLSELALQSSKPAIISNMCVVFAETEIIGLLASGKHLPDVVAGVQNSIATRVAALAGRFVSPPVYFTGGVALQSGMARALEEVLACPVCVASQPQFTGALGAAVLACERNMRILNS
jgi:predicted CoA-substrate-specific enzyme activase